MDGQDEFPIPPAFFGDVRGRPRERTRVRVMYNLAGRLPTGMYESATPMAEKNINFGRFGPHITDDDQARLVPRSLVDRWLEGPELTAEGMTLTCPVRAVHPIVFITLRGNLMLMVDIHLRQDATLDETARLLAETCFGREQMHIAGRPLARWVIEHLTEAFPNRTPMVLKLGLDVHQVVMPGGDVLRDLRSKRRRRKDDIPKAVLALVNRGSHHGPTVWTPEILNVPGTTFVAHSRGVTVLAGWDEAVENLLSGIACTVVSAIGVLRQARREAAEVLAPSPGRLGTSRLADLTGTLNQVHLDLSFGVQVYLDPVLVPEDLSQAYLSSLRSAVNLGDSVDDTSRILDSLTSIISARHYRNRENRSRLVAIGSFLALPPGLLFAFFSVQAAEVREDRSIFDLSTYWAAYLTILMPFIVIGVLWARQWARDHAWLER